MAYEYHCHRDTGALFDCPNSGISVLFLSCKTNAKVKLAKTGHGPHLPISFIVMCPSLYSLYCLWVNVYLCCCHRLATKLQLKIFSCGNINESFKRRSRTTCQQWSQLHVYTKFFWVKLTIFHLVPLQTYRTLTFFFTVHHSISV
jgi:hypothetical protein